MTNNTLTGIEIRMGSQEKKLNWILGGVGAIVAKFMWGTIATFFHIGV
jgi:hypothetical protein